MLAYNDPFVPLARVGPAILKSIETMPAAIAKHDCVIVLTVHIAYDVAAVAQAAKL